MKNDVKFGECVVAPFIDGEFSESESERIVEVINPANGRRCAVIPAGCDGDVNRAVASSRRSFDDGRWRNMPPSVRKSALHRLADKIEAESASLDALDAAEMGKPVSIKFGSAAAAAGLMRFNAEAVDKVLGDVYVSDQRSFVVQRRVPRGVVAAVVPWNFPTINAVIKVAPALAGGNCVVLKPSELASRSAVRLAELAIEAGIPPGVFNVVPGLGSNVGRTLGLHSQVDMLTFTGSSEVGKAMLQYSGQSNMKVVLTECGGKSAHIVFDDGIDLDDAAQSICRTLLTNQGQICSVGSRLLVRKSIEQPLLERIVSQMKKVVVGDPLDERTTFGPLASEKQCARVMSYIESAKQEGTELVIGGVRTLQETGGFFVEPTVFRNVSSKARIAQEEIFGPVLCVITFDNEAEAIDLANDTIYGLGAYVWTSNLSTSMRMAKGIRSSVRINSISPAGEGSGYTAAHEPAKQSGVGTEGGIAGVESYMYRQRVWFNHA